MTRYPTAVVPLRLVTWWRRRQARAAVILAAKIVESGYEPDLVHDHDPDDLHALREAVGTLRALEGGPMPDRVRRAAVVPAETNGDKQCPTGS